jgi:hypothetical protein
MGMAEEKQVRRRRPAAAGAGGFQVVGFPKEFERGLTDQLDVRYYGILLGVMLFTLTFIIVSSFNELTVSDEHLQSIREDYLQKMYKVEIVDDTPVEEEITEDGTGDDVEEEESEQDKRRQEDLGKQAEVRGPTAAERATARRAAAAAAGQKPGCRPGSGCKPGRTWYSWCFRGRRRRRSRCGYSRW